MSSKMQLTVFSAAVLLITAANALAQTGTAPAGAAPAPDAGPAQPAESQAASPPSQNQLDRPAPSGCPYRDGKLELIV